MNNPTLTIAMPVFNNPSCVKLMIDSIIANTYQDWELLAIDDGSEQETLHLLEDYAAADERIVFRKRTESPKGAQTCRNIGMNEGRGEFIVFFDSDDLITPDCLATRVEAIMARPELDFMVFPSTVLTDKGIKQEPLDKVYGYKATDDDVRGFCHRVLPFVVWNNIYRLSSLRKHNIQWDTNLLSLQDADFNMQTLLQGLKYDYCLCPPNYAYRIGQTGSITGKLLSGAHRKSNLYAIDRFYKGVTGNEPAAYLSSLYYGAVFVFYAHSLAPYAVEFGSEIASVMKKYDARRALLFALQVRAISLLRHLLPGDLVRKAIFRNYLRYRFDVENSVSAAKRQQML